MVFDVEKLKILVVPAWFVPRDQGHTGQFIRHTAMALSEMGHHVVVLTITPAAQSQSIIHAVTEHYQEYFLYEKTGCALFRRLKIRTIFKRWVDAYEKKHGRFDVIHTHGLVAIDQIINYRRQHGTPILHTEHLGLLTLPTIPYKIKLQAQYLYRYVHQILAVSPGMSTNLQSITDQPIAVIGGIVDKIYFETTIVQAINNTPTFICVSDFDATKGHLDLLSAFTLLATQEFDFKLHLVGDGTLRPAIEQMIAQNHLSTQVTMHGRLTPMDICTLMQDCDIYCSGSHMESFGTHIAEGIAMGLFAVCIQTTGPQSFITDDNGTLVPPGDIEALADALKKAAIQRDTLKKSVIRATLLDRFHPTVIATKTAEYLLKLVDNSAR